MDESNKTMLLAVLAGELLARLIWIGFTTFAGMLALTQNMSLYGAVFLMTSFLYGFFPNQNHYFQLFHRFLTLFIAYTIVTFLHMKAWQAGIYLVVPVFLSASWLAEYVDKLDPSND